MPEIDLGGTLTKLNTGSWAWMKYAGIVLLIVIIGFVILMRIKIRKRFPITTIIWEKRGDDIVTNIRDKIGKSVEEGVTKYRFRLSGDTIPIPEYDKIKRISDSAGVLHLYKYGTGQYKVIDVRGILNTNTIDLKLIDMDDWNFKVLENRATLERRKGPKEFFEKWGPTIGLGIIAMLIIISMYMSYNFIKDIAGVVASAKTNTQTVQNAPAQVPNIPVIGGLMNPGT